jgi:hypothetical protein
MGKPRIFTRTEIKRATATKKPEMVIKEPTIRTAPRATAEVVELDHYPFAIRAKINGENNGRRGQNTAMHIGFFLDDDLYQKDISNRVLTTWKVNNFYHLAPDNWHITPYYENVLVLNTTEGVKAFNVCHGYKENVNKYDTGPKTWRIRFNYSKTFFESGQEAIAKAIEANMPLIEALPKVNWTQREKLLTSSYGQNFFRTVY